MVDEMKKKMRRFEHLIGFKGRLDVTSRESMKKLITALDSRYKSDVQNSVRLHRLEFFYDLVEGRKRRDNKVDKEKETKKKQEGDSGTAQADEVLTIQAKDIDDWKDLMTLSKIYYVLEHPKSEGLTWKRRIAKKKTIDQFGDMDLIEWRVAQNFRLRGLEEWAQSRSDARRLAAQEGCDSDELEDGDARELYEMLDPSGRKYRGSEEAEKRPKAPFKFQDDCIDDWTESYSEDSDYSDEDFVEEIDDFPDEMERRLGELEDAARPVPDEEDNVAEILSKYPEFSRYREDVFERMDEAQTLEEWYKLYYESCIVPDEPKTDTAEMEKIIEEEEELEADTAKLADASEDPDKAIVEEGEKKYVEIEETETTKKEPEKQDIPEREIAEPEADTAKLECAAEEPDIEIAEENEKKYAEIEETETTKQEEPEKQDIPEREKGEEGEKEAGTEFTKREEDEAPEIESSEQGALVSEEENDGGETKDAVPQNETIPDDQIDSETNQANNGTETFVDTEEV